MMKKTTIVLLVLALVMSLTGGAMAADPTSNTASSSAPTLATSNDTGVAGTWTEKDTEKVQGKKIYIVKELLSFNTNTNTTSVYAPAFSYTYTVTPASVTGLTVTDEKTDHKSDKAVQAPVNQGITKGLKVNSGDAGTDTSAEGTLDFTNDTVLTTSSSGGSNTYNIELDFTGVNFTQPGVYRYEINETLADNATYPGIDIKDATGTNPNTRWLDVYVDGDLEIYGYVCMSANASVTPDTTKTNGFVTASNGADEYYTYDLELSKDVVNDKYGEGHAFPFTVIFNNAGNFTTTYTITETAGTGSTGISPEAAHAPTWSGVALVKEDGAITYTGIPAGVDVDVYETNDMTGVTYTVVTTINGTDGNPDNNVSWSTAPTSAVAQTSKQAYESTKGTVNTNATTASAAGTTTKQTLKITNTLLLISPTGVVLRIAPYVLILAAGIMLLLISRRWKTANEEE